MSHLDLGLCRSVGGRGLFLVTKGADVPYLAVDLNLGKEPAAAFYAAYAEVARAVHRVGVAANLRARGNICTAATKRVSSD